MRTLTILALLSLLLALLMGSRQIMAQYSPLPQRSPLDDYVPRCTTRCLDSDRGWDVDMCERACRGEIVTTQQPPERQDIAIACNRPGWHRTADWMGCYPLWTDGVSYCVEGR